MVAEALADTRVVVVNGARQVGKSTPVNTAPTDKCTAPVASSFGTDYLVGARRFMNRRLTPERFPIIGRFGQRRRGAAKKGDMA
jgi:hypothetical protein